MNTDFRVACSLLSHHKTNRLMRLCGHKGVVSLISLWAYAAQYAEDGDISKFDDIDLAIACNWDGEGSEIREALTVAGFVDVTEDGRHLIHQWKEHNGFAATHKARSEASRKNIAKRWSGDTAVIAKSESANSDSESANTPIPIPIPIPSPIPVPVLTKDTPSSVDAGQKAEKKALPKKPAADVMDARANPWALWVDVNRAYGRADPAALGPDLKAAKELGKATKDDNELRACMFAYLEDKDVFIAKQGWPMRLMCSRLNGYLNPVDPLGEYTWSDEDYIEQGKSCKRITVMLVRAFKESGKQNPNCPVTQGHLDAFAFWEKEGTLDT